MKITSLFISLFFFSLLGSSQDENPGSDTTRVSLGGGTEIIIIKNSDDVDEASAETPDSLTTEKKHSVDMQKFTYWAGIDLGVSTLLMTDQVKDENEWLDIDEKQSISFSLNVIEKKIPLIKHYLGLNTGLGFTWQNFEFNDSLSIVNLSGDSIVGLSAAPLEYEKNRLKVGIPPGASFPAAASGAALSSTAALRPSTHRFSSVRLRTLIAADAN